MRGIRTSRSLVATAFITCSCTTAPIDMTTRATGPTTSTAVSSGTTITVPVEPADTVLHFGTVLTVSHSFTNVEASAIMGGDIVAVGSSRSDANQSSLAGAVLS